MHSRDCRLCAVRIYRYLGSMKRAAKALGLSVSSISRWDRRIEGAGWPSRGSKIADAVEAAIRLTLDQEPSTTSRELRCRIKQRFGIDVSRQLVALVLRKKLKYSWKRTRKRGPRGVGWSVERVEEFKRKFSTAYEEGMLSSWDESSFDQRCRPVYGYAKMGDQAIMNVPRTTCSAKHHSLLLGMHMDGTRHHAVLTGSVKATNFADFVRQAPYPRGTVILLDNHVMHKTVAVREAAESKGYTLLNTPAYSPEFNPIEMVFGVTKNLFYRTRYQETFGNDMTAIIDDCLTTAAKPATVSACFRHVNDIVQSR